MDRTALITGAATGIGRALARKLDAEGWTVFAGVHRAPPDALLAGASPRLRALTLDVADDASVARARAEVEAALGAQSGGPRLELLISNAASTAGGGGPVECLDEAAFRRIFEVNFWGPFRLARAFLPLLRRAAAAPGGRARLINVTSASIYLTIPTGAPYPVSKIALEALTRHLRLELAPCGVEVTALAPGGVDTAMVAFPDDERREHWAAVPPALLGEYQAAFAYPGDALGASFAFQSPESFAELVHSRVICARRLQPAYLLGRGVAPLPWLQRLLPLRASEALFRRLFRARPAAARGARAPHQDRP